MGGEEKGEKKVKSRRGWKGRRIVETVRSRGR